MNPPAKYPDYKEIGLEGNHVMKHMTGLSGCSGRKVGFATVVKHAGRLLWVYNIIKHCTVGGNSLDNNIERVGLDETRKYILHGK